MDIASLSKDVRHLMNPHFVMNLILSVSFFIMKTTPGICELFFEDCELEMKELELLTFFGCVLVMKTRKSASATNYIGTMFMFAKCLSIVMFFRQNPLYGVVYSLFCVLHLAFFPEPVYAGPDKIIYFRSDSFVDEIEQGDKRVTWVIEFYAAWSPSCVSFAPVLAELSHQYGLNNLRFGKIDVGRYKVIAEKYKVDTSSWSRQLPTLCLIEAGKETMRRPYTDPRGKSLKFAWTKENVERDFSLTSIYDECRKNPIPVKKQKQS